MFAKHIMMIAFLTTRVFAAVAENSTYEQEHKVTALDYDIKWTISDDENVYLQISAPTNGWIGFGLTRGGGMTGSDIFLGYVDEEGTVHGGDYHALKEGTPTRDECASDWVILGGEQSGGRTTIELKRLLDTGDHEDWPLVSTYDDSAHDSVIVAFGDEDQIAYHGSTQRAQVQIDFGNDANDTVNQLQSLKADSSIDKVVVGHDSPYQVPPSQTDYYDVCGTQAGPSTAHATVKSIVAFEIDDDSIADEGYSVHHLVVNGYRQKSNIPFNETYNFGCNEDIYEVDTIWVGVPGVDAWVLPSHLRFPYGGEFGYVAFGIGYHYENWDGSADHVDNSSLTMFMDTDSSTSRQDVGVISFGDPNVETMNTVIPEGLTQYDFFCPSGCMSNQPKTVIKILHHMHDEGAAMQTTFRTDIDDVTVVHASTEYYDRNFQDEITHFNEPIQLQSSTSVDVRCVYDSANGAKFGLASADEMCISFVYYYPAERDGPKSCGYEGPDASNECGSNSYVVTSLDDVSDIDWRQFGVADIDCAQQGDESAWSWTLPVALACFCVFTVTVFSVILMWAVARYRRRRDVTLPQCRDVPGSPWAPSKRTRKSNAHVVGTPIALDILPRTSYHNAVMPLKSAVPRDPSVLPSKSPPASETCPERRVSFVKSRQLTLPIQMTELSLHTISEDLSNSEYTDGHMKRTYSSYRTPIERIMHRTSPN